MKKRSFSYLLVVMGILFSLGGFAQDYVDLGLPSRTLWAKTNVGASTETEAGSYFAWGESATKSTYTQVNYAWATGITAEGEWGYQKLTKYDDNDNKKTLEAADDAATTQWGSTWVTPTPEQFQELLDNCTWTIEGNGYRVAGTNGNSIYLPFAGQMYEGNLTYSDEWGTYITNTRVETVTGNTPRYPTNCYELHLTSSSQSVSNMSRFYGFSVRPVVKLYDVAVEAQDTESALHTAIGKENLANVVCLKVSGTINSYDIMIINNKMTNLKVLDLADATIVANSYEYYSGYCSHDNKLEAHSVPKHLIAIKVPNNLTDIGYSTFEGASLIKEIILPNSVTNVGSGAFSDCRSLERIEAPNAKIASRALSGCSNLASLTINGLDGLEYGVFGALFGTTSYSGGVSTYTKTSSMSYYAYYYIPKTLKEVIVKSGKIGEGAFMNCSYIEKITLPENLEIIGSDAFSGCVKLTNIIIPDGVTHICDNAFSGCTIESIEIPSSVESIGKAFNNCTKLAIIKISSLAAWCKMEIKTNPLEYGGYLCIGEQKIEDLFIPGDVAEINSAVFKGCKTIKSVSFHPNVKKIGENAFYGNTNLKTCVFPTNSQMEEISNYAFCSCKSLQSISFPISLEKIGNYAFSYCSGITEVRLPDMLKSIGNYAFYYCTNLNDVYTYTSEPQKIDQNTFSTYQTATLHCRAQSRKLYYYNTQWSQFLKLEDFDEPYEFIYLKNDFVVDNTTGVLEGNEEKKPEAEIESTGGLIVKDDLNQELGDVTIKFNGTSKNGASLIGKVKANKIYLELEVKADYWYTFSFPFKVDLRTIQKSGGYVFRKYDGSKRANGQSGWSEIAAGTTHLNANEGYIFRTNTAGTLTIVIDKQAIEEYDLTVDKLMTLNEYTATSGTTNDANKSWNFVGNPYISYYDMNDLGYSAPVVIWNGSSYEALRPGDDDLMFYPFQAFFVQKPMNIPSIGFEAADQTTYQKSQNSAAVKAASKARKARALNSNRKLINLTLTDGTNTDKARVVFNDEQKMGYEAECDAAQFEAEGVPQLFTLDSKGTKYAINERPMEDGIVKMGFTAPVVGEYTIAATRMDVQVYLVDNATGKTIDLNEGDYTFKATQGTNVKRFTLMVDSNVTGINCVSDDKNADKAVYDLNGRRMADTQKGVNIVNGKKVMVK